MSENLPFRAPLLSARLLRRIRARCVTRARRYWRNHPDFSRRDERYFFFGAMAVLGCFPDAAARELAAQWQADLFNAAHPPCDHSPAAQAARVRDAARAAKRDATLAAILRAGCDAAESGTSDGKHAAEGRADV
jgi:hypothetical protein